MRVCDGSCRRLTRLCRQRQEHVELIRALGLQAESCDLAGHAAWAVLMRRAADTLRQATASCCDDNEEQQNR